MRIQLYLLAFMIFGLYNCSNGQVKSTSINHVTDSIIKIEMNLSAFGVESDDFPSIDAFIDFKRDSSRCVKSYYNPANKGYTYSLTKNEMRSILHLVKIPDLEKLEKEYKVNATDQPRAITKIYTLQRIFIIDDYGMKGAYPLQQLYKIVYRY